MPTGKALDTAATTTRHSNVRALLDTIGVEEGKATQRTRQVITSAFILYSCLGLFCVIWGVIQQEPLWSLPLVLQLLSCSIVLMVLKVWEFESES